MKKSLSLWQFGGFAFTTLGGTLLHFLYDWTNKSILIAPFSAVNESTFEHMKLLYFPLFVFALVQSIFFKEQKNFWCVKFIGTAFGLMLIPVLFYTYNGVFGKSPDWLNIMIFFISAAAVFILEYWLFKNEKCRCNQPFTAFCLVCVIGVMFVAFTFITPHLPIFRDPITLSYGI